MARLNRLHLQGLDCLSMTSVCHPIPIGTLLLPGQCSSIRLRSSSALELASEMAHSRAGWGLLAISLRFRAARRIADFRRSTV